jgi:hypothetical protein
MLVGLGGGGGAVIPPKPMLVINKNFVRAYRKKTVSRREIYDKVLHLCFWQNKNMSSVFQAWKVLADYYKSLPKE